MNIETIPVGAFEENCSIIWQDNQAIIVDPGDYADGVNNFLLQNNLSVAAFFCTHGHTDHISALAELSEKHHAPIFMHEADLSWAFLEDNQLLPYYTAPQKPATEIQEISAQKSWSIAEMTIEIIHTPGHSPGSVCLYFPEHSLLISGDTLFKGTCGRTDLPGGNPKQLKESLQQLSRLPEETQVIPGHGPNTTIAHEKEFNFFMN